MGPRDPFSGSARVLDEAAPALSAPPPSRPAPLLAGALAGAALMLVWWALGWAATLLGLLGAAAGAGAVVLWRFGRRHLDLRAAWEALLRERGAVQEHEEP